MRLLSVLLLGIAVWAQAPSALESNLAGWLDVLPGPALEGWTRMALPSTQPLDPVSQWKADTASRVLVCEGNRGHEWLRYGRELADAIFHVEWRFTPVTGGKGYNSGIFIRTGADGVLWHQAQTGDRGRYLFGNTLVNGRAERINLREQMPENRVKEAREWNTYELRAEGGTISLLVSGAVSSEFTACEIPKGYAGLEAEGYRIEFRNLKLKELAGRGALVK